MPNDVIITPASKEISFQDGSNAVKTMTISTTTIQIDGLKKEVSKKNWKLKMGKFEKVIIGVAGVAAGILIK